MSYILDALRRAEAERERGEVPSLHTQQYAPSGDDEARRNGNRTAWLVGSALGVALIVIGGWKWLAPDSTTPNPPLAGVTTLGPAATPLGPPPTLGPAFPLAPAAAPGNEGRTPARLDADESAARASRSGATDAGAPGRAALGPGRITRGVGEKPALLPGADTTARRSAVDSAPAKVDAAAPGGRVYAQAELPDDVRRGLPTLNVGGASYSSDASSRMVIINGQVLHEGDKVADGLVLKQIKLRSAILAFRSYRFEISY